ncbi:hypothetical protein DFP72DRAFT_1117756 [Ephemerocybe angulata]|uniref:Uncharacterized protein n=1 Tax=Ephemerocybe angulata TaxID=980116 RepID=A0A8H6M594_9AGAR|nr:hypothetical protein DFP72DRAFT_1117756 [Tulosesus angulatus]
MLETVTSQREGNSKLKPLDEVNNKPKLERKDRVQPKRAVYVKNPYKEHKTRITELEGPRRIKSQKALIQIPTTSSIAVGRMKPLPPIPTNQATPDEVEPWSQPSTATQLRDAHQSYSDNLSYMDSDTDSISSLQCHASDTDSTCELVTRFDLGSSRHMEGDWEYKSRAFCDKTGSPSLAKGASKMVPAPKVPPKRYRIP